MDQQTTGKHFHIGMRIVKTVIAVFVCGLIASFRGESAFYSMIAAVVCVQNSAGKTVESSVNRMLGTLIGGVVGVAVVYLLDVVGLLYIELARYAVLALMLIPIIEFCLLVKRPGCAAMACIVFLCVTVNHSMGDTPVIYSIQRLFETLVGVAVACVVDVLLPYRSAPEGCAPEVAAETEEVPEPVQTVQDVPPEAEPPAEDGAWEEVQEHDL